MTTPQPVDVLVIGGGPGGYVAAIRAAQLGLTTACCESNPYDDPQGEPRLGGTCLNVGCIPSKALLHTSYLYALAAHDFTKQGIQVTGLAIDVPKMLARKDAIVAQLTQGIKGLFRKNNVTLLPGHGRLLGREYDRWVVAVGETTVAASHVIIATGSLARHLPHVPVDNEVICDNVGALKLGTVPKRLVIIGAGAIGLEMGSVWRRLGAEVVLLEAAPRFLAAADPDIAKEAMRQLQKQGLQFALGVTIEGVERQGDRVTICYRSASGEAQRLDADRLIVAVGRVPNTAGLGADAVGLALDAQGGILVDEHCRTNLPNLWAVGDVVRGPMLAHKAMEEGVMVAERIAGQAGHVNYDAIPWVIYTEPEVAWVGKTESELKAAGVAYRVGKAPFVANGRALGMEVGYGFVKMLACAQTDRLLGVHIIGPNASELIAEAVVALEFGAAAEDLARICHAHPTLSEVVHEAALAVDQRPLHC